MDDEAIYGLHEIMVRLSAAIVDVDVIATDADNMFWAPLGAPHGAIPEAKLVFARSVGHVICLAVEGMALERGLGRAALQALRATCQTKLMMDIFVHLPGFSAEEDTRSAILYSTRPSGRGDPIQELVRLYVQDLEALFRGKAGRGVRRSAELALEVACRRTLAYFGRQQGGDAAEQ